MPESRSDPRVLPLLDSAWPQISRRAASAATLGADWHALSRPFIREHGRRVVAHAGILSLPLVLNGRSARWAGVHAVCTDPAFRGRGHFKAIMNEVVETCSEEVEGMLLFTGNPELYTRFGFECVQEHRFLCRNLHAGGESGDEAFRPIKKDRLGDLELLWKFLKEAKPSSYRYGFTGDPQHMLLNEVLACGDLERFYFSPRLEGLAVFEILGASLRLYDWIGAELPDLEEILACMPRRIHRVELYFSPDRFPRAWTSEPMAFAGDQLMVRGDFPLKGQRFMVPPLAHC